MLISILIPSLILMKMSGEDRLGPTWGLIIALAFPVCYGLYDFFVNGNRNVMAVLGFVSVLLTGGIGLLQIDAKWIAIKEAAIPLCIGIGVIVANKFGYPLVRKLLFNPELMNTELIQTTLDEKNNRSLFDKRLNQANYFLAGTFFFSAVMNYGLAKFIVKSESGTSEFTQELGRMGFLSYPVIVAPSIIMMLAIFWFIWRTVSNLTGLSLEEIMVTADETSKD